MGKRERLEPPDYEEEDLQADGPSPIHWAFFALGAVRRRKALAAIVFAVGVFGSVAYYLSRTPLYRVEASILAQKQQSLSTMRSGSDEAPTRSAWELVHRRENLLALVEQTHLYNPSSAPPPRVGFMTKLKRLVSSAPVDDDPLNALVLQLDRKLVVKTSEGTVSISIDWPDPDQAYRIVKAALQNFLEARHLQEVTALDEVISLMQGRLAALGEQLDKAVLESRRMQAAAALPSAQEPTLRPSRSSAPADSGDESGQLKLVQLKSMLEAKERAIADVEEFRRRRLADLQAQLDQTRGVYSEQHPAVINLRQDIEALSRESPQISALRDEERKLRQVYAARLAQESRSTGSSTRHLLMSSGTSSNSNNQESERVREARMQYQQMLERVNAAQVELDAARAAFKYRYNVMWPAQVPKKPVSPSKLKILGVGPLVALVLAILAAAAADLRAGRIVERWQVEHGLDLPILAELERK